jgi:hypothetical protein
MSRDLVATELPTLRFRLPGQWSQIPLHERAEARTAIERLVELQVGKADQYATLRRDIRSRLLAALEAAIDGSGQSMHVALNVVPEVPISASFTVFLPAVALTPALGTTSTAVMDVFERGLATAADMETAQKFGIAGSEVLRVHRETVADFDDEHRDIRSLVVDYWLTVPGTKRIVLVSFSTLFSELAEVMITFFDSILRASYWEMPAAGEDAGVS